MLRHNSKNLFFFQIFELGNIFKNFNQRSQKSWFFLPKYHFFGIFWHFFVKIFQNIA